jgi:hypothetical protein
VSYHGNISYFFRILKYLGCKSIKRIVTPAGFPKLFLPLRLIDHPPGHASIDNDILSVDEVVLAAAQEKICAVRQAPCYFRDIYLGH